MDRLAGKVAIVTGGSQGIGLAMARVFAREGAAVVVSSRRADAIEAAARDLAASGAQVLGVQADVAQREDVERTIAQTIERFGRIDILVNNAQSTRQAKIEDITDDSIALTFGSGLFGTLYHMQAAFPHLRERGGSVINFGTRQGIYGEPGDGIYGANKEGVRALSRSAAREWGRFGIRVNVINPAALSPAAERFLEANPVRMQKYLDEISLGRFGSPDDDIAPIALFLASDEARYVTGQTINADGGQIML
ncbi:SDR family NAD(P)-dependent oxidoreductase [uncultured Sphingomonas sp.]|uniref:SDR family NAD(P)-dependent oxidoreductase n=1 Tax=uncultured Sphingomonas sp. TaxID=158754 RepID=UPI0026389001|nr:SDR family NAD(P)-dependent oxidoreductase [uncultured Sphingomonas sp.]